jgi:hypothetical protein
MIGDDDQSSSILMYPARLRVPMLTPMVSFATRFGRVRPQRQLLVALITAVSGLALAMSSALFVTVAATGPGDGLSSGPPPTTSSVDTATTGATGPTGTVAELKVAHLSGEPGMLSTVLDETTALTALSPGQSSDAVALLAGEHSITFDHGQGRTSKARVRLAPGAQVTLIPQSPGQEPGAILLNDISSSPGRFQAELRLVHFGSIAAPLRVLELPSLGTVTPRRGSKYAVVPSGRQVLRLVDRFGDPVAPPLTVDLASGSAGTILIGSRPNTDNGVDVRFVSSTARPSKQPLTPSTVGQRTVGQTTVGQTTVAPATVSPTTVGSATSSIGSASNPEPGAAATPTGPESEQGQAATTSTGDRLAFRVPEPRSSDTVTLAVALLTACGAALVLIDLRRLRRV